MLSSTLLTVSTLLLGVRAQSGTDIGAIAPSELPSTTASGSETATATSSGATTHTVSVGASGHKMTPDEVKAEVGDIIEWKFYPDGHWIIRGDFDNPCIPYEYVGTTRKGFSSGPQSVKAITDDGPRFRVRVNDTEPIFFYCGAPGSCVKYHMMGVVNPTKDQSLDAWLEKANDVDYQLRPGEPFPTEDGFTPPTASATPDDPSRDSSNDGSSDGGSGLSSGAIAGIAIGGAAVLVLGAGLIYLCGRRGGFDKAYRKSFRNSAATYPSEGGPAVAEAQFGSPHTGSTEVWSGHKQPSPMSAVFGQSPPMSPQPTPGYAYQQGTMGSYYNDQHSQHLTPPPPHHEPPKQEPVPPAELPASSDPGNSPLPSYNSNGAPRTFSWAGEESAYRPQK